MKNPLVSIIIPAYNVESYIKNAIESALNQTYKNIEIIVVDDGSTDNTKKIIEPYFKSGKIKYIYQHNKGLSSARNTGIKTAQGEYVALLDSDDEFLPEKIEKQVGFLEARPDCDICYCDIWHFQESSPDQLLKINYKYYSGKEVFKNLLKKNFINPLSVVFRRKVFDKFGYFNENYRRSEDWEYWLGSSYRGTIFCFLPEILAKHRLGMATHLQDFKSEPIMWKTTLKIFKDLEEKMPAEEKKKYKMKFKIFRYQLRYLWALLLSQRLLSFFRWFQRWRRLKRFQKQS
jgi:glycosyltransferase involved in cell wall biosynthesis